MDNKKVDNTQQQAPPSYDDIYANRTIIDEVCQNATVKGAVLAFNAKEPTEPFMLTTT
jgi:hypothetical protein